MWLARIIFLFLILSFLLTLIRLSVILLSRAINLDSFFFQKISGDFTIFGQSINFPNQYSKYLFGGSIIPMVLSSLLSILVFQQIIKAAEDKRSKNSLKNIAKKELGKLTPAGFIKVFLFQILLRVVMVLISQLDSCFKNGFSIKNKPWYIVFGIFGIFFSLSLAGNIVSYINNHISYFKQFDSSDRSQISRVKSENSLKAIFQNVIKSSLFSNLLITGILLAIAAVINLLFIFCIFKNYTIIPDFKFQIHFQSSTLQIFKNSNNQLAIIYIVLLTASLTLMLESPIKKFFFGRKEKNPNLVNSKIKESLEQKRFSKRKFLRLLFYIFIAPALLALAFNAFGQITNSTIEAKNISISFWIVFALATFAITLIVEILQYFFKRSLLLENLFVKAHEVSEKFEDSYDSPNLINLEPSDHIPVILTQDRENPRSGLNVFENGVG